MTPTSNPYQPPNAPVDDLAESSRRRPVWVWVICIFWAFGVLGTMASTYLLASGRIPVEGPAARYFESLGVVDYVLVVAEVILHVALVVTLFRLQRAALSLGVAGFVLNAMTMLFYVATNPHYAGMLEQNGYGSLVIGWLINIAVLIYIFRLRTRGVLR